MDQILRVLKALADPTRVRLVSVLSGGELAVNEIATALAQSQPRISRHLKLLTEAGVIERRVEGAWVFYRLAEEAHTGASLARQALAGIDPGDQALSLDRERLAGVRGERARLAARYFEAQAADWDAQRAAFYPHADELAALERAAGAGPFRFYLDLGAGTGRSLAAMSARARRAEGVDASREMLTVARAALDAAGAAHARVVQGDIMALSYPDGAADLISLQQVLHYLPEPGAAVREAARVLASGGRLVVTDLAPHTAEELRSHHAHRRLGFCDEEVLAWFAEAGLSEPTVETLAPGPEHRGALTVKVWSARKPAAARKAAA
jgi:ArsR family transcriptional regulator